MRLAFIGGNGHHYLRGAVTDAGWELDRPIVVAGDGLDDDRAEAFARGIADARWMADPLEMLDRHRPHVVSVGVRYGKNGDFAALALERGIHVVSDKPVAATWEQFYRLEKLLAANPKLVLATEFDFRCRPEFCAARQAVLDGKIGAVALAVAQKSYKFGQRPAWYADRASYGGTLMWVSSHGIDAIRFVTGKTFVRAFGTGGKVSRPDYGSMEDHVVSVFELQDGGSGVAHADFLRSPTFETHGDDRLRVIGSKGQVEVIADRCWLTTHDRPREDITETITTRPMHLELLAALRGESEKFGTASSLEMAKILLHARDAQDMRGVVEMG